MVNLNHSTIIVVILIYTSNFEANILTLWSVNYHYSICNFLVRKHHTNVYQFFQSKFNKRIASSSSSALRVTANRIQNDQTFNYIVAIELCVILMKSSNCIYFLYCQPLKRDWILQLDKTIEVQSIYEKANTDYNFIHNFILSTDFVIQIAKFDSYSYVNTLLT